MRKAFNVRPKQIEKKNLDQSRQKKKTTAENQRRRRKDSAEVEKTSHNVQEKMEDR